MSVLEILRSEWEITRPQAVSLTTFKVLAGQMQRVHPPRGARRHCFVLHGFHSQQLHMTAWRDALSALPQARDWHLWMVNYDTHWKSFRRSARLINAALRDKNCDWDETILIGYSMGGLVARQMVAGGFPCRALMTLCTPHQGPISEKFLGRTAQLAGWPRALRALNAHPRDVAARARYHFFANTFHDARGQHPHDGLVSRDSALGVMLGEICSRQTINLSYENPPRSPLHPHLCGMNPQLMQPALEACAHLMER